MFLCSPTFILGFMPISIILYWILPKKNNIRNIFLIIAGLLFYSFGDAKYIVLFLLMSLLTYTIGLILNRLKNNNVKKVFLVICLMVFVIVLSYFKYWNYIAINIFNLKSLAGLTMPLGISFFVFKEISYVVDVYKSKIKVDRNVINVLAYICYFPQIISGPISRYEEVIRGIQSANFSVETIAKGFKRFSFGFFQKIVIAGVIGKFVDQVYGLDSSDYSAVICITAAICYSLQLYMDFAGYSSMSIGLSQMMGIEIKENFDYPFISKSVSEFWRRWHISLSSWFKDYVYIPLGGSRCSKFRTCVNKMIVFILTGIWHGSSITFLIWGVLHGIATTTEVIVKKRLPNLLSHIVTLIFVVVTFSIFRAGTMAQATQILKGMINFTGLSANAYAVMCQQFTLYFILVILMALLYCIPLHRKIYCSKFGMKYENTIQIIPYVISIVLLFICITKIAVADYSPFIYFKF